MTYDDIVREQTRDLRDQLQRLAMKRSDLDGQKQALIDQGNRLRGELSQERKREVDAKRELREYEKTEDEILRRLQKIDELRSRLNTRLMDQRSKKDGQQSSIVATRLSVEDTLGRIRAKEQEQQALTQQIEAVERGLQEKSGNLRAALGQCIRQYLDGVWRDIASAQMSAVERTRQRSAFVAFQRARHEDPRIADLFEQREQYQQLLKQATVPAVRNMLLAELDKATRALNAAFPGAMEAQQEPREPTTLLVLYEYVNATGQACVLMPFGPDIWKTLAEGSKDVEQDRAMRLMHAFVSGKNLRAEDGHFSCADQFCAYESTVPGEDMDLLQEDFSLELPAETTVVFRLAPLPLEAQEAINADSSS